MKAKNAPAVSIITPSFNQGKFIKETIETVLSQDFKDLEHIVVDGGSSDETLNILKRFSKQDSRFRFISEPDNGQSHAINKGLSMAKGQIIGWLNSDDTYMPGAIRHAVQTFNQSPEFSMVYGDANITDKDNKLIMPFKAKQVRLKDLFRKCPICQPAVFMKKRMLDTLGGVDESLDFCMDYDLWIRVKKGGYKMVKIPAILANSRYYPESKSGSKYVEVGFPEIIRTSQKHFGTVSRTWMKLFLIHFRKKGVFWFLNLLRDASIFKDSPVIANSSKKNSQEFKFNISNISSNLFSAILIEVSHQVDGELALKVYGENELSATTFIIGEQQVLLLPTPSKSINKNLVLTSNREFSIENIAALSNEEKMFAEAFIEGDSGVRRWINQSFMYT